MKFAMHGGIKIGRRYLCVMSFDWFLFFDEIKNEIELAIYTAN